MLICVFSEKLTKKIVDIFVKILKFFKVKKLEEKKERLTNGLEKYNNNSKYIKTYKTEFVKSIIMIFLQIILSYLIPFFVYKSFGLNEYNLFQLFTIQAVLYTTVSGLPLPGAIGVSESVFLGLYGNVFGKDLLESAMLLNRGISFYIFVIISLTVVIINIMKNKKIENV